MKLSKIIIILAIAAPLSSCKKFLELNPPKDQLVTESVFVLNETATSAMTSIYATMMNITDVYPSRLAIATGLSSDELINNSANGEIIQIYRNNISSNNTAYTARIWNKGFNIIYQANAVFEGCTKSIQLDVDVKKQLLAEARFIRAYWNFYLVNLFGEIPIVTTIDYNTNALISKNGVDKVYELIISDLLYAKSNLNAGYVNATSFVTGDDRIRPNKAAAASLLARVYLYRNKFAEAETESTFVIDQTTIYNLTNIDDVFKMNSQETIWALTPTPPNQRNTSEGADFILTNKPSSGGIPTLSDLLLNEFTNGDNRKNSWVGKYTDNTVTPNKDYFYPFKYKIKTGNAISEYSIILRLAEQYLIRAESRAKLNKVSEAAADLDMIRLRAGLNSITTIYPTLTQDQIIDATVKERQLELFTEQGHRWLDLKRLNLVNKVMSTVTPLKGGTWNAEKQLWPIPLTELLNNPNLKQNPGYN
jgi:starch-binding outer membrane protein, SusD/RagB family